MKRVALVLHAERQEAAATGHVLAERLDAHGVEVFASAVDASRIAGRVAGADPLPEVDLVFVLGGDGTLLRAAEQFGYSGPPLLGINFGHLGFLSELERAELDDGITRVVEHGFEIDERTVLRADVEDGGERRTVRALNDIIVAKTDIGRAIRLRVSIEGTPLVSWAADGVIVATATGSTAYSFSAGGPVVSPRLDCLLVTPVAPHGWLDRSLVAAPNEEVTLDVLPDADRAALSADGGPATPLSSGAVVRARVADERIRLAKLDPAPFWGLVRDKFRLPADGR